MRKSGPRLFYFGHVPAEGAGSAIIVLRHLQRLHAAGWAIHVIADWGQEHLHAACHERGWPVMTLPHRRAWWPPWDADRPVSRALRARLWAGEVRRRFGDPGEGAVLTYLSAFSDTLSLVAAGFAQRYRLPCSALIHDDARCFAAVSSDGDRAHARRQWIVDRCTRAWFASPELADCFRLDKGQRGILPPIPEGAVPIADAGVNLPQGRPRLVYAGNYWPAQIPAFIGLAGAIESGGGRLETVLKEDRAHADFLRSHGVDWRPAFARNSEALDHFRRHATALVVSYARTTAEMPWTRTSFPSKLIEYCHLGLPILIVAPTDSAVSRWAHRVSFTDIREPDDAVGIAWYTRRLQDPAFRRERARRSRELAAGEFDPVAIHRRLEDGLRSGRRG